MCYLGQLWLGEARLAHLRRLAHGDIALSQRPLGEGLGGPILAGLAVWSIALTATLVSRATDPLAPATPRLTLHSSTTLVKKDQDQSQNMEKWFLMMCYLHLTG